MGILERNSHSDSTRGARQRLRIHSSGAPGNNKTAKSTHCLRSEITGGSAPLVELWVVLSVLDTWDTCDRTRQVVNDPRYCGCQARLIIFVIENSPPPSPPNPIALRSTISYLGHRYCELPEATTHRHPPQHRQDGRRLLLDVPVRRLLRGEGRHWCPVPHDVQVLVARQLADDLVFLLEQRPDPPGLLHFPGVCIPGKRLLLLPLATVSCSCSSCSSVVVLLVIVVVRVVRAGLGGGGRRAEPRRVQCRGRSCCSYCGRPCCHSCRCPSPSRCRYSSSSSSSSCCCCGCCCCCCG